MREEIKVKDESSIVENIGGRNRTLKASIPQDESPLKEETKKDEVKEVLLVEPEPVKEESTREENRRRKSKLQVEPEDYVTLFLHEVEVTARSGKTVYICKEHHDRITKILHSICKNKVSLFSYIYNVLEQHFETHRDGITELYEKNRENIF